MLRRLRRNLDLAMLIPCEVNDMTPMKLNNMTNKLSTVPM